MDQGKAAINLGFSLADDVTVSEPRLQSGSYLFRFRLRPTCPLFAGSTLQPQSVKDANLLSLDFNDTCFLELSQSRRGGFPINMQMMRQFFVRHVAH